ncbi:MAG: abortive infection family protein [Brevundimonas sp.]
MRLSARTIGALKNFVTGDNNLTPYRSGPALVRLFNEYGSDDSYPTGGGFPSRHVYAEDKLKRLNDSTEMGRLLEEIFDPLEFEGTDRSFNEAVEGINPYLARDGWKLVSTGGKVRVATSAGEEFEFEAPLSALDPSSSAFVADNADKCRRKMREGDYRGAITNARSLLEDVLVGVERKLSTEPSVRYDGDLPKLLKRVRKMLKMEAELHAADRDLFVMLNGLTSVVDGLAGFSNRAGDRHGGGMQPVRHHAALIVSSALAVSTFVAESATLQLGK